MVKEDIIIQQNIVEIKSEINGSLVEMPIISRQFRSYCWLYRMTINTHCRRCLRPGWMTV